MNTMGPRENELLEKLSELKKLPKAMEEKIINIMEGKEGDSERFIKDLYTQFQYLIEAYIVLSKKPYNLCNISTYPLLNSAFEGLIKIIIFLNSPKDYFKIAMNQRTIGSLKGKLISILENHGLENDKITIVRSSLDLIQNLRNTFIHFPFYYNYDYRFEHMYFQLIAFILETFDLWTHISLKLKKLIIKLAMDKPNGTDLFEGVNLYETE